MKIYKKYENATQHNGKWMKMGNSTCDCVYVFVCAIVQKVQKLHLFGEKSRKVNWKNKLLFCDFSFVHRVFFSVTFFLCLGELEKKLYVYRSSIVLQIFFFFCIKVYCPFKICYCCYFSWSTAFRIKSGI